MVRLRRPPEWGVEPVPDSLRVLRTFDLFVLWSSLGAGLLVFAAGALLVQLFGLTLWEAFLVSLVGSVLGRAFGRGPKLARTIRDLDRLRIDDRRRDCLASPSAGCGPSVARLDGFVRRTWFAPPRP